MTALQIPSGGLILSNATQKRHKADSHPSQLLRLNLLEEETKELLKTLQDGKPAFFRTGKQPSIRYREQRLRIQPEPEQFPSDLYSQSRDNEKVFVFTGKTSHNLEVQRARETAEETDAALETLQNTLKSLKEERALNQANIVHSRDDLKKQSKADHKPSPLLGHRKDLLGGASRSTPSSPYLSAAFSPRHGPTSAPAVGGGLSAKDKIRLDAMKIPFIHLLASQPMSSKRIQEMIRISEGDCDKLLDKYAQDSSIMPGKKELRQKAYRELDVWKFPYQGKDQRQAAIDRAVHAYDRMRVAKSDPLWQMLLPLEERGKGKTLSKLNFNKPAPAPSLKATESSDVESSKSPMKKAPSSIRASEKRRLDADSGTSKSRAASPSVHKKRDSSPNPVSRNSRTESKFKSNEVIEDSDEEAEAANEVLAKPQNSSHEAAMNAPSASVTKRTHSPSPKKQIHKSSISSSSDSSDSQPSRTSLAPGPRHAAPVSNRSPRPRHDSSPQKPSPLGSSPPTTSTDADSSSSTKGTSQSSAPSSPPSSTDMPIAKEKQKYSPVITDRARDVSRGRAPTKRKSDEMDEAPPAKRQQVERSHTPQLSNGVHVPPSESRLTRNISESEQSSSPEKRDPAREDIMDEAKRFQLYYKKYKELHEKIASTSEKDREDKDLDDLWRMHKRLGEMKTEIWDNWEKVEKLTAT